MQERPIGEIVSEFATLVEGHGFSVVRSESESAHSNAEISRGRMRLGYSTDRADRDRTVRLTDEAFVPLHEEYLSGGTSILPRTLVSGYQSLPNVLKALDFVCENSNRDFLTAAEHQGEIEEYLSERIELPPVHEVRRALRELSDAKTSVRAG